MARSRKSVRVPDDLPEPGTPFFGIGAMKAASVVEIPSNGEAQRLVAKMRRNLSELPAPPAGMNTISAVLMYSMLGLSDADISVATGIGVEQIVIVRASKAYIETTNDLVKSVLDKDSEDVKRILAESAAKAAKRTIQMMDSELDAVALKASESILDRTGHRPVDRHEHLVAQMTQMRIEFVKPERELPVIEGDVK